MQSSDVTRTKHTLIQQLIKHGKKGKGIKHNQTSAPEDTRLYHKHMERGQAGELGVCVCTRTHTCADAHRPRAQVRAGGS